MSTVVVCGVYVDYEFVSADGVGPVHCFHYGMHEASCSRLGVYWYSVPLGSWARLDDAAWIPDQPAVIAAWQQWLAIREVV